MKKWFLAGTLFAITVAVASFIIYQYVDDSGLSDEESGEQYIDASYCGSKLSEADFDHQRRIVLNKARKNEKFSHLIGTTRASFQSMLKMGVHVSADSVVANIGCGTGGFEIALLENSIAFRRLYAVDIDKPSLEFLDFMLKSSKYPGWEKISTVHSSINDVRLPPESLDIAFCINIGAFHARLDAQGRTLLSPDTQECLTTLQMALKPNGLLHVFEKASDFPTGVDGIKMMRLAFEDVGFQVVKTDSVTSDGVRSYYVEFIKGGNDTGIKKNIGSHDGFEKPPEE